MGKEYNNTNFNSISHKANLEKLVASLHSVQLDCIVVGRHSQDVTVWIEHNPVASMLACGDGQRHLACSTAEQTNEYTKTINVPKHAQSHQCAHPTRSQHHWHPLTQFDHPDGMSQ